MQKSGRLLQAAQVYSDILQSEPENANAWHLLGTIEITRRDFEAAQRLIDKALGFEPDNAIFHHNRAFVLGAKSQMAEAIAEYRLAIDLKPDYAEAHFNLAQSLRVRADDPMIASLQGLLANPASSETDRCYLNFAAGKVFDDLGDYDRAFAHYQEGNRAKGAVTNPAYSTSYLSRILEVCDSDFLHQRFGYGLGKVSPIFIVGMPRSGTSLVEQILASHPQVFGAGELPLIDRIAAGLGEQDKVAYPDCLPGVPAAVYRGFAKAYMEAASSAAPPNGRFVTDKAPLNFRHLGLIGLLFPEAKIIHCRRDPLDTCLSCFFQNFVQGQEYSFDLVDLGRFYQDYRRMMMAWERRSPLPIHQLDYEDLVADLESVGRGLLTFCGLDWHPDCARFFETRRPVLTASRAQVRQPLYRSSIGRWRRYAAHLGPLVEALGPYAEAAAE